MSKSQKSKQVKKSKSPAQTSTKKKPGLKIIGIVVIVGIILYLALSNILKKNNVDEEYMFKKQGELTFLTPDNKSKEKIDIQIADSDFDRELGLMFRKSMEENQGMLFIFPQSQIQRFWMRNTLIPLDMIFINSQKQIVTIRENTKVLSDQTYASTEPAKYVLEVNAGFCKKFDIKVGDKVSWARTSRPSKIPE